MSSIVNPWTGRNVRVGGAIHRALVAGTYTGAPSARVGGARAHKGCATKSVGSACERVVDKQVRSGTCRVSNGETDRVVCRVARRKKADGKPKSPAKSRSPPKRASPPKRKRPVKAASPRFTYCDGSPLTDEQLERAKYWALTASREDPAIDQAREMVARMAEWRRCSTPGELLQIRTQVDNFLNKQGRWRAPARPVVVQDYDDDEDELDPSQYYSASRYL
jgi:hypothetical protein